MTKIDILIVGAGPTGLILACLLLKSGITCKIIDKEISSSTATKAVNLSESSLFLFKELGLLDLVLESGLVIDSAMIYWKNKKLVPIKFNYINAIHPFFFHITQPKIESILNNLLIGMKCCITRATKLNSLVIEKDNIVAKIEASGVVKDESFKFVIGCDGNNSTVRDLLNIPSLLHDYNAYFLLIDVILTSDLLGKRISYFIDELGYIMFVPIPEEQYRIVISFPGEHIKDMHGKLSNNYLEAIIKSRINANLKIKEIKWITSAPFRHRVAQNAVRGNVALAGDALHIFSPIGGTNINMGIKDAANLARKIIKIQQLNENDGKLLSEYEFEQKKMIYNNLKMTMDITNLLLRNEARNIELEKKFSPIFCNRDFIKYELPKFFCSQL